MSLTKVVPYVLGVTKMPPGAPEPRMYPRSRYFLVRYKTEAKSPNSNKENLKDKIIVHRKLIKTPEC